MKISIISFGSSPREWLGLYKKEINKIKQFKYQIEFINLSEHSQENIELKKMLETKDILQKIPKNSSCYLFTERGKTVTSKEFSQLLNFPNICFIIGGSFGVDEKLIAKSRPDIGFLSFGKLTFAHKIFKLIVLEQIYRGFSIKFNRKYHHAD